MAWSLPGEINMAMLKRIVATVSATCLALAVSGTANGLEGVAEGSEKFDAKVAAPKNRISTREAMQVVRELTASLCGLPSQCSFTIDPRGGCPFEAFVILPTTFQVEGKPAPILRIGLDRRGALIGMTWAPSAVCAKT
jgi:hypothetical protein